MRRAGFLHIWPTECFFSARGANLKPSGELSPERMSKSAGNWRTTATKGQTIPGDTNSFDIMPSRLIVCALPCARSYFRGRDSIWFPGRPLRDLARMQEQRPEDRCVRLLRDGRSQAATNLRRTTKTSSVFALCAAARVGQVRYD